MEHSVTVDQPASITTGKPLETAQTEEPGINTEDPFGLDEETPIVTREQPGVAKNKAAWTRLKAFDKPFLTLFGEDPASGIPELDEPGLKVLHVQEIDFDTTCYTFVQCLQEIRAWSDANPGHLPLTVLVEAKDEAIPDPLDLGFVVPLAFDAVAMDTKSCSPDPSAAIQALHIFLTGAMTIAARTATWFVVLFQ